MPGKDGSNAGCVFRQRPPNRARNASPTSFMTPAQTIRSGSYSAQAAARASSQASLVGKSPTFVMNGGKIFPLSPPRAGGEAPAARPAAGHDGGAVLLVAARVDEGLQVRPCPRDEHNQPRVHGSHPN